MSEADQPKKPLSSDETTDLTPAGAMSAGETVEVPAALREGPGMVIGPYKILQLIGEGGFGSVFLAQQERPVQRRVALKIIKLGMDTRQVVARFEQERQALALMDHPNIARVLDAGATETGRPFFVMELVKGEPIVEYCDKNNVGIRARLELFAQVCVAVQHAHTKGIIHRDIKPSNILVSMQDGKPDIKVIDFGIAKATASKLTEKTLFTEHRQLIGTPAYMSPEQAEGSLDIDTRTDVYSLGVLLYELLTGSTPFGSRELRSAAYGEMERMIREVEPPRPSTRLSQNSETIASIAAHRQTEPKKLGTIVRGELDWIVMKALEKDRNRRYETANGLAMDLRRYLSGEAVSAAPPSRAYRARKFVKRNRGLVTSGAGVAAALLVGAAGFAWQAHGVSVQRDVALAAQRAEAEQRRIAEGERTAAEVERNRAMAAEAEATRRAGELKKVADFQGKMLAQVDPTTAGARLTEDVRARFDAALAKGGVPAEARAAQAEAFAGLWGRVNATDAARQLIETTILKPAVSVIDVDFADQPVVAAALKTVLAERYQDLGLDEMALALEQQSLAARRKILGEDHPDTLMSIANVGVFLNGVGRTREAETFEREALEKSRRILGDAHVDTLARIENLAGLLRDTGRMPEAEPLAREALEGRRKTLGEDSPDTLLSLEGWARLLEEEGKLAEAEVAFRDALAKRKRVLGEDHVETQASINDLAVALQRQGKLEEGIALLRDLVARRRRLLGEAHPKTLNTIQNLGAMLDGAGHPGEADVLLREALENERRVLGADHESTLASMGNLSTFLLNQEKYAEAEAVARETLERRRRVLGEDHPTTLIAMSVMGLALINQDREAEAEPYVRQAVEVARRTLGPSHPQTLIFTHNLGSVLMDQKKNDEAEKAFREAVKAGEASPTAPAVLSATRKLATILLGAKRDAEAAEVLSAGEPAARKAGVGRGERSLGAFLTLLGKAQNRLGQREKAEATLLEAQKINVKTGPAGAETRGNANLLSQFYAQWDKAEPGKGYGAKAAEWKAEFEKLQATTRAAASRPASK